MNLHRLERWRVYLGCQHASPGRSPIISSAPSSAQRMVTRSMRARQTQPARSHLPSRVVSRKEQSLQLPLHRLHWNRQHHKHHLQHSRHLSKSRLPRRKGRAEGLWRPAKAKAWNQNLLKEVKIWERLSTWFADSYIASLFPSEAQREYRHSQKKSRGLCMRGP